MKTIKESGTFTAAHWSLLEKKEKLILAMRETLAFADGKAWQPDVSDFLERRRLEKLSKIDQCTGGENVEDNQLMEEQAIMEALKEQLETMNLSH